MSSVFWGIENLVGFNNKGFKRCGAFADNFFIKEIPSKSGVKIAA